MPQINIKSGDTLSKIAAANGTTVADIMAANKGNAAVKSADMISAGGMLNLPDRVAAPAGGPTNLNQAGGLDTPPVQNQAAQGVSNLSNLRMALREALNEAASKRVSKSYEQLAPIAGGVPGSIGSIVEMIRGGVKAPVEQTFSDIISVFKDENDAKQKELDRVNQLRLEYGSAIPTNVTSLEDAIKYVTPLVDKDRADKLRKVASDQAADNDIESWAESYAKGEVTIGNIPAAIRTQVKVRADKILDRLNDEAKTEYKNRISFKIEKKQSDFESERANIISDENLTVAEQREMLEYIDGLEDEKKTNKQSGKKQFSGFAPKPTTVAPLVQAPQQTTAPSTGQGPANLMDIFGPIAAPFRNIKQ